MASVNSYETDIKKLKRGKKGRKLFKRLLTIIVFIAVVLLLYLSRESWLPYFEGILESGYSDTAEDETETNFPFDISSRSNTMIGSMRDCWVMFADTSISTYNASGASYQSVYAPYGTPVIETASTRTLLYDMGGYNLMVISRRSEVFDKKLDDQILFAEIGDKGNIAVVTATDKYPSYLTIYDKNGTEIFHWADGNYIMAVALDDSGNGCAVASIYASGGIIKTLVYVLDFSSTEIQAKSSAIELLPLELEFTSSGKIWLVGDSALCLLDGDCGLSYRYDYIYDISCFDASESVCAISFERAGGSGSTLAIFKEGLDEPSEIAYNDTILHIVAEKSSVYLNTSSVLEVLDSSGNLTSSTSLDSEYTSFVIYDGSAIFMNYRSVVKKDISD